MQKVSLFILAIFCFAAINCNSYGKCDRQIDIKIKHFKFPADRLLNFIISYEFIITETVVPKEGNELFKTMTKEHEVFKNEAKKVPKDVDSKSIDIYGMDIICTSTFMKEGNDFNPTHRMYVDLINRKGRGYTLWGNYELAGVPTINFMENDINCGEPTDLIKLKDLYFEPYALPENDNSKGKSIKPITLIFNLKIGSLKPMNRSNKSSIRTIVPHNIPHLKELSLLDTATKVFI